MSLASGRHNGNGDVGMKAPYRWAAAVSATVALTSAATWAQTPAGPYGYGPQMMWGWGWYGKIFGPLFMIRKHPREAACL